MVVACNGVGTPRLLLMSGDLANGSDQVGRNLMHNILVAAELWVEEPPPLTGAGVVVCLMG
jgi:2-methyl-1,2-propanediol dehydrogenase